MCVSPRRHPSTGKHTLPGLPHRTRTPLRDIHPPKMNLQISVYPLIRFCIFVFRKNYDPPHLRWRNWIYLIVQVTGSDRGKVFPLVNSGILVSSNSLPHGQPYPVWRAMRYTQEEPQPTLLDCLLKFMYHQVFQIAPTKPTNHYLGDPLPLPRVRKSSSLPSTVGCCVPSWNPGHLDWKTNEI